MHIATTVPTEDPARSGELFARLEAIGYDTGFSFEAKHDPFLPLALASQRTTTLRLGTAVAIGFARNPMVLANVGYDLQAVRAIWDCWERGTELAFDGDFYHHGQICEGCCSGGDPTPGGSRHSRPRFGMCRRWKCAHTSAKPGWSRTSGRGSAARRSWTPRQPDGRQAAPIDRKPTRRRQAVRERTRRASRDAMEPRNATTILNQAARRYLKIIVRGVTADHGAFASPAVIAPPDS